MTEKYIHQECTIVNTDNEAYEAYIQHRRRLQKGKSEIEDLKSRVMVLENKVLHLIETVKQLTEGS